MNKTYTKEEMEQLGKQSLIGSQSCYAHVHATGSIYFDHQDEQHENNKETSIKVVNESLKKAEATNEDLSKVQNELSTEKSAHETTKTLLETEKAAHENCNAALTTAIIEIENLQAALAEWETPTQAPEPAPVKTEEKATKK